MRLVVLSDNNTLIGQCLKGEPGACYYIEDGGKKILLDTGFSNVFLENAAQLGIDLSDLSVIAISHGHDDHVTGLPFLAQRMNLSDVEVVAHPTPFVPSVQTGCRTGPS